MLISQKIKIKDIFPNNAVCFAPMAGVSDVVYRGICAGFGADITITEMVSALGIKYNPERAKELRIRSPKEKIAGIQLFGDDPAIMAAIARDYSCDFDFVDVNMGCPAPKIVRNNQGSALMKTPEKAYSIIKEISDTLDKPVTVKIRTGWDKDSINAVEFAIAMQEAGASMLTIHGRHRSQYYQGKANLSIIRDVVEALSIPVIGNGDIYAAEDALAMKETTGCSSIMIARGAQGNPFIFSKVKAALNAEPIPTFDENDLAEVILTHANGLMETFSERGMSLMMRKHLCWYSKGIREASHLKKLAIKVSGLDDIKKFCDYITNIEILK